MIVDVARQHRELVEQIRERADTRYRDGNRSVINTQLELHGVRIPHLRDIAREWRRANMAIPHEDLMVLVEALWDGPSQEERLLAMELLRQSRGAIARLTWGHFDRWRWLIDNWGLTDCLGAYILALWLTEDAARLEHLGRLIDDDHVWSRRLALVATVPINRNPAGMTIPDLTFELIDRVKHERDPMITKGVSWALRALTKVHADRVAIYLEANAQSLAAHVVREVRNKLHTGLKSGKVRG